MASYAVGVSSSSYVSRPSSKTACFGILRHDSEFPFCSQTSTNVLNQIAVVVTTRVPTMKVVITVPVISATDLWMMTNLVRVSLQNVHLGLRAIF